MNVESFLEVAVHSIQMYLTNLMEANSFENLQGEYFVLKTGYTEAYKSGVAFHQYYDVRKRFVHPIKFGSGNADMIKANLNFFKSTVMQYSRLALKIAQSECSAVIFQK